MKMAHRLIVGILGATALLPQSAALAQSAPGGFRSEYRLTDREKEQILATAEAKAKPAQQKNVTVDLFDPPAITGEAGFSIGTDGSRSAFGSAFYPFGPRSGAMISIDMDRFGDLPPPAILANPNR